MKRKIAKLTFKKEEDYWVVRGSFNKRTVGYMYGSKDKKRAIKYIDTQVTNYGYTWIFYLNGKKLN